MSSDPFIDFYFDEQGAMYGWMFQYMLIGRGPALDMVVPPGERVEMLARLDHIVRDRKIFCIDFWNSGVSTSGCICAGRPSGYFYIDWNGNITPCVFIPYAVDNIKSVFARGENLNDILKTPLFKKIREWQDQYGFKRPAAQVHNWLCPCVMRDHFAFLKQNLMETKAQPINPEAAAALADVNYDQGMAKYDKDIERLTDPIWKTKYADQPADGSA